MLLALTVIVLAFIWLLWETNFLTVRLESTDSQWIKRGQEIMNDWDEDRQKEHDALLSGSGVSDLKIKPRSVLTVAQVGGDKDNS